MASVIDYETVRHTTVRIKPRKTKPVPEGRLTRPSRIDILDPEPCDDDMVIVDALVPRRMANLFKSLIDHENVISG